MAWGASNGPPKPPVGGSGHPGAAVAPLDILIDDEAAIAGSSAR